MKTTTDLVRTQIRADLLARPTAMMLELAHAHDVPELAILEVLGAPRAQPLDASRWEELFRALPALGEVRVIVSNAGTTMEAKGEFGGFSRTGPYFNVQTRSLDLHVRWAAIASAIAVEKPSHQTARPTASVQLFDPDGAAMLKIFLVFGEGDASENEGYAAFVALRERFRLADH